MANNMPIQTDAASEEQKLMQQLNEALIAENERLTAKIEDLKTKLSEVEYKLAKKKHKLKKRTAESDGFLDVIEYLMAANITLIYGTPEVDNLLRILVKNNLWIGGNYDLRYLDSDAAGAIELLIGKSGPISEEAYISLIEDGSLPSDGCFMNKLPMADKDDPWKTSEAYTKESKRLHQLQADLETEHPCHQVELKEVKL